MALYNQSVFGQMTRKMIGPFGTNNSFELVSGTTQLVLELFLVADTY
jgi:hypothetical protein